MRQTYQRVTYFIHIYVISCSITTNLLLTEPQF